MDSQPRKGANNEARKLGDKKGQNQQHNDPGFAPSQQRNKLYGTVNGMKVGKGWLEAQKGQPMPVEKYRSNLFAALSQARDKYVQRQKQQGGVVPGAILDQASSQNKMSFKTIDPEIPDFSSKRNAVHKFANKFAGVCMKTGY